jgi:hypothetical protein
VEEFFEAAALNNWTATSNTFRRLEKGSGRLGGKQVLPTEVWGAIHDTFGAYEQFREWEHGLLHRFGEGIIRGIPPGSIYFGGTDAGRFIVSALCESHSKGRPFFTLTQNALVDKTYREYVRDIYGDAISIPDTQEASRIFTEYADDAAKRKANNQLGGARLFRRWMAGFRSAVLRQSCSLMSG